MFRIAPRYGCVVYGNCPIDTGSEVCWHLDTGASFVLSGFTLRFVSGRVMSTHLDWGGLTQLPDPIVSGIAAIDRRSAWYRIGEQYVVTGDAIAVHVDQAGLPVLYRPDPSAPRRNSVTLQ